MLFPTFREGLDLLMNVGSDGCFLHLTITGRNAPVADVVSDVVIEQDGVLRHHSNMGTQRSLLHLHNENKHRHTHTHTHTHNLKITNQLNQFLIPKIK